MQPSGADTNHQRPDNSDSNFDALIDLLASDDIYDIVVAPSDPSHSSRVHLRDATGKLDFDKIRLMFANKILALTSLMTQHKRMAWLRSVRVIYRTYVHLSLVHIRIYRS
jgi:hypothetical protein